MLFRMKPALAFDESSENFLLLLLLLLAKLVNVIFGLHEAVGRLIKVFMSVVFTGLELIIVVEFVCIRFLRGIT